MTGEALSWLVSFPRFLQTCFFFFCVTPFLVFPSKQHTETHVCTHRVLYLQERHFCVCVFVFDRM